MTEPTTQPMTQPMTGRRRVEERWLVATQTACRTEDRAPRRRPASGRPRVPESQPRRPALPGRPRLCTLRGIHSLLAILASLAVFSAACSVRADAQAPTMAPTLNAPAAPSSPREQGASNSVSPSYAPSYVLSPDDQIEITVLGHADFTAAETVLPDGTFNYPVLGKVHAGGQTLDGLTALLVQGLSGQLNQPQVTVTLHEGRPSKVSVLGGASKSPGQYDCRSGMHLLDLIAVSGGPLASPELASATLVTGGGKGSVPIDLPKLLAGDVSQNVPLAPGDILFLAPRDASVAQVQVLGEVAKPGAYDSRPDGVSVLALMNLAGGPTPKAALTQAQVMHGGSVTVYNLRPLLTSDLTSSVGRARLVPGDVLLIPTNTARILALGEVGTKGVFPIPDGETLPLTVALAEAGGITADGDKKNVDVVRRGPDGKPIVLVVNADDLLRGKNNVADLNLRSGDILYVQTRNHPQNIGSVLGAIGGIGVLNTLTHL